VTTSKYTPLNNTVIDGPTLDAYTQTVLDGLLGPPSVLLQQAVGQSIPAGTAAPLNWDSEIFKDVAGWHSIGTNPSRLIFPSDGFYAGVGTYAATGAALQGLRIAFWRAGGSNSNCFGANFCNAGANNTPVAVTTFFYGRFTALSYLELMALHFSNSVANTTDLASDGASHFGPSQLKVWRVRDYA
jgi:hypothetical protein